MEVESQNGGVLFLTKTRMRRSSNRFQNSRKGDLLRGQKRKLCQGGVRKEGAGRIQAKKQIEMKKAGSDLKSRGKGGASANSIREGKGERKETGKSFKIYFQAKRNGRTNKGRHLCESLSDIWATVIKKSRGGRVVRELDGSGNQKRASREENQFGSRDQKWRRGEKKFGGWFKKGRKEF